MDKVSEGKYKGRGPKGYRRSDDRIKEDINDRLSDDSHVDASDIDVTVSNCEVTLSGTVESRDVKRRAEDIAESVSGVTHVQNNLRVGQSSSWGSGISGSSTGSIGNTTSGTQGSATSQTTSGGVTSSGSGVANAQNTNQRTKV